MKKIVVLVLVLMLVMSCFLFASCDKKEKECEHNFVQGQIIKAPTCTQEGIVQYVCSKCGETTSRSIAPTGHNFVDGVCTDCGAHQ